MPLRVACFCVSHISTSCVALIWIHVDPDRICMVDPWEWPDGIFPKWLEKIIDKIIAGFDQDKCLITGATVMCTIYGVILCATFFGLMSPSLQAINLGQQSAAEIYETIHRVPEMDPASHSGMVPKQPEKSIQFSSIVFLYPTRPKNLIFANFDLTVPIGSSVALVGPSGSGKR